MTYSKALLSDADMVRSMHYATVQNLAGVKQHVRKDGIMHVDSIVGAMWINWL